MGLAFYETRSEYMSPVGNVREINREDSTDHTHFSSTANNLEASHSPSTSNLRTDMCPITFPGFRSNISRLLYVTDESGGKSTLEIGGEMVEPKELYGKPILFPCHLRHRRITPFKDSFRHSYLYVGIPVGLRACYSPILSIDLPYGRKSKWPFRRAWFNIRAQDHAIRGGAHMTMAQKLREYLLSEVSVQVYLLSVALPSATPFRDQLYRKIAANQTS